MAIQILAAVIINDILEEEEEERMKKQTKKKRLWVKKWILNRKKYSHTNLMNELKFSSTSDYTNFLRMDAATYEELLAMVKPYIERKDTNMRDSISANERLSATLRFLATGRSYSDLKFSTRIAKSTLSVLIIETCQVLRKVLKSFIKLPKNEDEWREVAKDYEEIWNFPHCIGALDGKHVNIIKPTGTGAYYFNYKKTYSIVLMALVNSKYEFMMVEAGANGRVSDGGVFSNTKFGFKYENNELKIPPPAIVDNYQNELPYVIVADDAFPLGEHLLKPYSSHGLTKKQENFNFRLSRARNVVENTFGIISSRFRILLTTIHLDPDKATDIVLAICYLHNFLRKKIARTYIGSTDIENSTANNVVGSLIQLQSGKKSNASTLAKETRNNFSEYFASTSAHEMY